MTPRGENLMMPGSGSGPRLTPTPSRGQDSGSGLDFGARGGSPAGYPAGAPRGGAPDANPSVNLADLGFLEKNVKDFFSVVF